MMKKALIVGVGKIGTLKAKIYKAKGYYVAGSDPNTLLEVDQCFDTTYKKLPLPDTDSYFDVVDICVPTKSHSAVLKDVIQHYPLATIIVEKPLASTRDQLSEFQKIVHDETNNRIIYSENYVFSSALDFTKKYIKHANANIESVVIEFSKDRSKDMANGRFIDEDLKGFGIEIPHMLAILDYLDVTSKRIQTCDSIAFGGKSLFKQVNKLIDIRLSEWNGTEVRLIQSLSGKQYVKNDYFVIPSKNIANSTYRVAKVTLTNGEVILIQLEPISGLARYFSKVVVLRKSGTVKINKVFSDNTLENLICSLEMKTKIPFLSLEKAIEINQILIELAEGEVNTNHISYNNRKYDSDLLVG